MRWNFENKKIQKNIEEPKLKNPLFNKEHNTLIYDNFDVLMYLSLFFILILIYCFFYAPWFNISEIEYKNIKNISPISITENYIKPKLNGYNYLFFRQLNIFNFNKNSLIENLLNDYSFDSILIEKKLPNKIIISINEKKPALIYQSNIKYYIDENGIITKMLSDEELNNEENLPLINNLSNEETKIGQQLFSKEKLDNIITIINLTKNYDKINIKNYEIPVLLSTQFNIFTEDGYKIFFDLSKNPIDQFNRLKRVIEEATTETPTEYIDLRIGERVYVK